MQLMTTEHSCMFLINAKYKYGNKIDHQPVYMFTWQTEAILCVVGLTQVM